MNIIGRLNDEIALAAVGLGTSLLNIFVLAFYLGLNSALATLASQAIGAGRADLAGVLLWRARIVMVVSFIFTATVLLMSTQIFLSLGEDENLAH
jgi:Na+-driven multidrug efflux pump